MCVDRVIDGPASWPGHRWLENGQSALTGSLLRLYRRLDRQFLDWADAFGAEEYLFPTFIPARELERIDWFRSFPHLATFPVALAPDEANLRRFTQGPPVSADGEVAVGATAPVRDVLTPAACYHVYVHLRGRDLARPAYLTTRATCFRREAYYAPLERQWSFSMREIVCVGTAAEVQAFLDGCRATVAARFEAIGLPVAWQQATDPFFDPSRSAKYLAQRLDPIKTEMVYGGHLAIGSVNVHRNYFGEAFGIARDGEPAYTGCVAFGLERWLYAFLREFGPDEARWPAPEGRADV